MAGGRPKGSVGQKTLEKEALRLIIRERVAKRLLPLLDAQIDNAMGIKHFMLRDKATGKFERITEETQIDEALKNGELEEGSHYWIYTKDPSVQAWTDLANRTTDKPIEPIQMEHSGSVDFVSRLTAARKRASGK